MIEMGWVDFSSDDRDKVMSILDMLKDKNAIDELGIGRIRDRLADRLFPGTSTIQTRAKYFLIVPWVLKEIQKSKVDRKSIDSKLHKLETDLIDVLLDGDEKDKEGIIGKTSRKNLKRKPTSIYWNGVKKYKLTAFDGSLSEYMDAIILTNKRNEIVEELLFKGDNKEIKGDDRDASLQNSINLNWSVVDPPEGWKDNLEISLNKEQALFLKDKIINAVPESLFAYILQNHLEEAIACDSIYELSFYNKLPQNLKEILDVACNFANVILGSSLRFNIILGNLNEYCSKVILDNWERWCESMGEFDFDTFDIDNLYAITKPDPTTRRFLDEWFKFVKNKSYENCDKIDEIIRQREISLKGNRSKIRNHSKIDTTEFIGLGLLNYRWYRVRKILQDINEGMERIDA